MTINLGNTDMTLNLRQESLKCHDRFYYNQFFKINSDVLTNPSFLKLVGKQKDSSIPDCVRNCCNQQSSTKPELIGVIGKIALHIYDRTSDSWLYAIQSLGYQHLSDTAKN